MSTSRKQFVIVAPPYHPTNGGAIVLHYLCRLLNDLGYKAKIFLLFGDSDIGFFFFWMRLKFYVKYHYVRILVLFSVNRQFIKKNWWTMYNSSPFKNPMKITPYVKKKSIVVYPETVSGNPLNAPNVVRWLLYKPGFHTSKIDFGKNDLFFYYHKTFNDIDLNPNENMLKIIYLKRDVYKQTNSGYRSGKCYIIRKGKKREDLPDTFDGIIIDNLPDDEVAKIFNQCEYCISYDQDTTYLWYASMCGCIPVVMPILCQKKEEWEPQGKYRYGMAYGMVREEIRHAQETRENFDRFCQELESNNIKQVQNFITVCSNYLARKEIIF